MIRPVHYDQNYPLFWGATGAWHVSSYQEVKLLLSRQDVFGSGILPKVPGFALSSNIAQTDPPAHSRLKKHLSAAFMEAVNALPNGYVNQEAEQITQAALNGGPLDFVSLIAQQLPLRITSRIIGIDQLHHHQVYNWIARIITPPSSFEEMPLLVAAQHELQAFLQQQIEGKEDLTGLNMISRLLNNTANDRLDSDEILSACMAVFMAGHETTANLLTNLVHIVATDPTLQHQLRNDHNLIAQAIEETLRQRGPVKSIVRILRQDTDLLGPQMNKGEYVVAWIAHANHDPSIFKEPDTFDLYRNNSKESLSFGHGIHGCIGSMLGKAQARAGLATLLNQTRSFTLAPGSQLLSNPSDLIQGIINLPLIYS